MSKFYIVFIAILALVLGAQASLQITSVKPAGDTDLCSVCVSFMGDAISDLLNIILNAGVIGSCDALCGQLSGSIEQTVCDLLCSYVGIDAFVHLLQDVDPDPIWICEEIDVCAVATNASGYFGYVDVSPPVGRKGTTFDISVSFTITSPIGTGEVSFEIAPPNGEAFGTAETLIGTQDGSYQAELQVEAKPSEQEPFDAGVYMIVTALCEGTCGSIHSNSYTIATDTANFTIKA